jgi:hypothetical protein
MVPTRFLTISGLFLGWAFLLVGGLWVSLAQFIPDGIWQDVALCVTGFIFAVLFVWMLVGRIIRIFLEHTNVWTELSLASATLALLIIAFAVIYHRFGIYDNTPQQIAQANTPGVVQTFGFGDDGQSTVANTGESTPDDGDSEQLQQQDREQTEGHPGVEKKITHNFWLCLYYSVVTFTTLGYGDFYPVGAGRFMAALQALLGYLVLGMLASSSASLLQAQAQAYRQQRKDEHEDDDDGDVEEEQDDELAKVAHQREADRREKQTSADGDGRDSR